MKKIINCKTCGEEIAAKAKVCPKCGAKNRRPFFKRWWVWICIILLVAAVAAPSKAPTNAPASSSVHSNAPTSTAKDNVPLSDDNNSSNAEMTTGQKNALKSAKNYLNFSAFSYDGLINQLEFEKYTHEDAVYAVDNCGADWNEQALKSAKNYLSTMAFSYNGLIKQLEFENFTLEQASYAVDNCGADWAEQAVKSAKNYLNTMSFSRDSLIQQLEFEGFTHEQAVFGAEQNGY